MTARDVPKDATLEMGQTDYVLTIDEDLMSDMAVAILARVLARI